MSGASGSAQRSNSNSPSRQVWPTPASTSYASQAHPREPSPGHAGISKWAIPKPASANDRIRGAVRFGQSSIMPKHEPKPHKHTYEQIVYILAGKIRFHIGDKSVVLGPGGLLQIPPDVMHWGEVVGDEPVLNLDIFTPMREEYAPPPSA